MGDLAEAFADLVQSVGKVAYGLGEIAQGFAEMIFGLEMLKILIIQMEKFAFIVKI